MLRRAEPWERSCFLARAGSWPHCRTLLSFQGGGLIISHTIHGCCHPLLCVPDTGLTSGECCRETVYSAPAPRLVSQLVAQSSSAPARNENKQRMAALLPGRQRGHLQLFAWIQLQQQQSYNRN